MICLEWSRDWRLALQTEALWLAFFNGYITEMKYIQKACIGFFVILSELHKLLSSEHFSYVAKLTSTTVLA
jgi:hypothetical protein